MSHGPEMCRAFESPWGPPAYERHELFLKRENSGWQKGKQLCTQTLALKLRFAAWGLSWAPEGHLNMSETFGASDEPSFGATATWYSG